MRAKRLCLALVLLTTTARLVPAVAGEPAAQKPGAQAPSPPSQAGAPEDEVEPPPAPLQIEPEPAAPPPAADAARNERATAAKAPRGAQRLTAVAWSGVAATLALVTAGTVLGVLAQRRSDELSRSTVQVIDGQPPLYAGDVRDRFDTLQREGASYNRATLACFIVAGVTAVASGLLFWDASRLRPPESRLAARARPGHTLQALRPELSLLMAAPASRLPSGGVLTLAGRF